MSKAGLPRQEKSLATARSHRSLKFEDASADLRRLSGSCGGGGRQDALFTEEAVGPLASDEDADALAAHKRTKNQGLGKKKMDGLPKRGGDKVTGHGQTLNG